MSTSTSWLVGVCRIAHGQAPGVDEAIKSDRLKPSEGMRLLDDYERGLKEYTYLTV